MNAPRWYRAESERYLHLDALRFISAAAITLFHYRGESWPAPYAGVFNALNPLHLGVDLFFVISGIMMGDLYAKRLATPADYGGFMRKRVARIVPLHYATFLFFLVTSSLAVRFGAHVGHVGNYDPGCILPNLAMVHAFGVCATNTFNTPSWSISGEMAMYLILPLLLLVTRRRLLGLAMLGLILAALTAWDFQSGTPWTSRTHDFGVLRALPSFLLGLLLADSRDLLGKIPKPGWLLALSAVVFAVLCTLPVPDSARVAVIYLIVALALAADQQARVGSVVRAAAPLGRLTYSLYMLNEPVLVVFGTLLGKRFLHLDGMAFAFWLALVALVALPAASVASLVWFETPMRRWISGRRKAGARVDAASVPAAAQP